jgi:hypothetical protein
LDPPPASKEATARQFLQEKKLKSIEASTVVSFLIQSTITAFGLDVKPLW